MKPIVFVLVTGNPHVDGRPAEAIRIAAGVATWKKADVSVYLHGPAIPSIGEWVDELVDDDTIGRYLPLVTEGNRPIYVEAGHPSLGELGETPHSFQEVSIHQLAELVRTATYTLRF